MPYQTNNLNVEGRPTNQYIIGYWLITLQIRHSLFEMLLTNSLLYIG
jgi:hypothetical protein